MKIVLEIPKEFESDYKGDKFKDFFSRVLCDIENGTLCGNYEKETAEMLLKAFDESKPVNESVNGDLISRSALLDSFRKCYSGHMGMENSDNMLMFKSICKVINNQPTACNNGWIPCERELPKEYGEYLCCDKYGEYVIGFPNARVSDNSFYVETDSEIMNDCIAWQPLPKRYED